MENWLRNMFGRDPKAAPQAAPVPEVRKTRIEKEDARPAEEAAVHSEPQYSRFPLGPAASDWAPGQELLGDFVIEKTLGEGGMGKVYLVRSRSTSSRFAVKRAKVFSGASRRSFLAELQTWIDLPEHPNLVPCRFFRTVGDEVLIFAEYVEGAAWRGGLTRGGYTRVVRVWRSSACWILLSNLLGVCIVCMN